MDRPEVLRQVCEVGARLLHVAPDGLSGRAVFDDLDSLARLELALALEAQLDVELPEEVVTSFETVDELVDAVLAQLVLVATDRPADGAVSSSLGPAV